MATKRDYYEILEITREANGDEIKRSYRKLALKWHPDRNPGNADAESKFKEAAEAYEILSDGDKKKVYDQFGHAGLDGHGMGGGARGFSSFEDIFRQFSDVFGGGGGGGGSPFDELFGGRGRRGGKPAPERGPSLKCQIKLTLDEVERGAEKTIELRRNELCETCSGSGAKSGSKPIQCPDCGGYGQVQVSQGFFAIRQTCGRCHGEGTIVQNPCATCHGSGRMPKKREITVHIPAGVPEGAQLRVAGEGEPGKNGGPRGDLYCFVQIAEHAIFKRDEDDLVCDMPISFSQAALGADVDVPSLKGKNTLKIPRGTNSGKVFRLKGLGLPSVNGYGRGDLLVRVNIEVPKKLAPKQEELLREFAKTEEHQVGPERKGWLDKVKELFD